MNVAVTEKRSKQTGRQQYKCISADCHLDFNWLPGDLFTKNASAALKDRMPYISETPEGALWLTNKGAKLGFPCGVGAAGRKYVPGSILHVDVMAKEGLYTDESRSSRRLTDPHQRVKDQDRDGIQAEVLYGITTAVHNLKDSETAEEVARIYNEWLASFCSTYPDRLIGLSVLPGTSPEAAVAEFKRVAKRGIKGAELAVLAGMRPLIDPTWEPLWKLMAEHDVPVHFHGSPALFSQPQPQSHWSPKDERANFAVGLTGSQLGAVSNLSSMILSGALERYPTLKVVLGEAGIGWIPYVLDRMDYEWEDQFRPVLDLKMLPSEYWKRQCKATFQYDTIGMHLLDYLGAETLMWASDFPHPDGVWPESQMYIEKQFGHLPDAVRNKIVCDNAVQFYKLG